MRVEAFERFSDFVNMLMIRSIGIHASRSRKNHPLIYFLAIFYGFLMVVFYLTSSKVVKKLIKISTKNSTSIRLSMNAPAELSCSRKAIL